MRQATLVTVTCSVLLLTLVAQVLATDSDSPPASDNHVQLYQSDFAERLTDWDLVGPGWAVVDGVLKHTIVGYGDAFTGNPEWTDYTVQARVRILAFGEDGSFRLFFRMIGSWLGFAVNLTPKGLSLMRFDGAWNKSRVLGQWRQEISVGKEYTVTVTAEGKTVKVSLDDTVVISTGNATTYSKGRLGVRADNIQVDVLEVAVWGPASAAGSPPANALNPSRSNPSDASQAGDSMPGQSAELKPSQVADLKPSQTAGGETDQAAKGYLAPGTSTVGGVRNILMAYTGYYASGAGVWSAADFLPYIAYSRSEQDSDGTTTRRYVDWFFDTFLLLGLQAPSGHAFDSPLRAQPAVKSDWQWYLDSLFAPDQQLAALEQGVQIAQQRLGDPNHKVKVIVMIPNPSDTIQDFGDVNGDGQTENFSLLGQTVSQATQARVLAVEWYINQFEQRFREQNYQNLELVGYYWVEESIHYAAPQEKPTIQAVADYIHGLGRKFFWFPYFQAAGYDRAYALGFDVVIMQPNYMFDTSIPTSRLEAAATLAQQYGLGVEIEADGSVLTSAVGRERYLAYLRAGVSYGYMAGAVKSYYQVVNALAEAAASDDSDVRSIYDATYHFVRGDFNEQLP